MRRVAVLVLVLVTTAIAARAQNPQAIIVFGTVHNADKVPVAGAEIWIDGFGAKAMSNDSGEFRIDNAPSGRVTVRVRRIGFRPDSKKVSLATGDTRQVAFVLDGMADELDAVLITARATAEGRLQEFWARRSVGLGVFITRADIERRHAPRAVDLFSQVLGVRVMTGGNGGSSRLVTGRTGVTGLPGRSAGSGGCPMQYYVDGVFMTPGTFTVDELTPDMIEAVEIFRGPSEIPARFRQRDTGCGLVVFWTREPPPRMPKEKDERTP